MIKEIDARGLRDDLLLAARFLIDDGFSIECDEAVRIGLRLAEMAGMVRMAELETDNGQ